MISFKDLVQLFQDGNLPLNISKSKLKLFDGTLIQPVGVTTLIVVRRRKHYDLQFQVVESPNKLLLSAETCVQLGLLNVEIELGHVGDTAIITDPKVKPIQRSQRQSQLSSEIKLKQN